MSDDVMDQQWCCLTCNARFRFGELRSGPEYLRCPTCGSGDIHPATGETVTVPKYEGERGPLQ